MVTNLTPVCVSLLINMELESWSFIQYRAYRAKDKDKTYRCAVKSGPSIERRCQGVLTEAAIAEMISEAGNIIKLDKEYHNAVFKAFLCEKHWDDWPEKLYDQWKTEFQTPKREANAEQRQITPTPGSRKQFASPLFGSPLEGPQSARGRSSNATKASTPSAALNYLYSTVESELWTMAHVYIVEVSSKNVTEVSRSNLMDSVPEEGTTNGVSNTQSMEYPFYFVNEMSPSPDFFATHEKFNEEVMMTGEIAEKEITTKHPSCKAAFHLTDNYFKIGYSQVPEKRIMYHQEKCNLHVKRHWLSKALSLPEAKRLERLLHMQFGPERVSYKCEHHKGYHDEYFKIEYDVLHNAARLWQEFLEHRPYENPGHLKEEWRIALRSSYPLKERLEFGAVLLKCMEESMTPPPPIPKTSSASQDRPAPESNTVLPNTADLEIKIKIEAANDEQLSCEIQLPHEMSQANISTKPNMNKDLPSSDITNANHKLGVSFFTVLPINELTARQLAWIMTRVRNNTIVSIRKASAFLLMICLSYLFYQLYSSIDRAAILSTFICSVVVIVCGHVTIRD